MNKQIALTVLYLLAVVISFFQTVQAGGDAENHKEPAHWLQQFQDDDELFSLDGYRLFRYRSPTPKKAEGGVTIDTDTLQEMLTSATPPALLDVQPLAWNNVFIQKEQRQHIPGSTWIPNVGLGEIDDDWAEYFRFHLHRQSQGNTSYPIVIYCRADCWMSWNAVKRAAEWGYSNLYWYRNGTDAWRDREKAMVPAVPQPFPVP